MENTNEIKISFEFIRENFQTVGDLKKFIFDIENNNKIASSQEQANENITKILKEMKGGIK